MAGANLIFKNPRTGIIKVAPTGFSWTVLLFGFLVPLHRKDWLWTAIILFSQIVTFGLAAVPFAFLYNKLYARKLIKRGYLFQALRQRCSRNTERIPAAAKPRF